MKVLTPSRWLRSVVVVLLLVAACGGGGRASAGETVRIADDGRPIARIVVSAEPSAEAWFAAGELRDHLRKITGADIPIVTDAVPISGPKIFVGASDGTRSHGFANDDFEAQEYLVGFRPDAVLLLGRDAQSPVVEHRLRLRGTPTYAPGRTGTALEFGTGLSALAVGAHGMRDEAGTLEAWVWFDESADGTIFRIDGGDPWSFILVEGRGRTIGFAAHNGRGGPDGSIVSRPLTPREWHQVTAVYAADKGLMKLYVDGESQGVAPYVPGTIATAGHLSIGGFVTHRNEVVKPFKGRLDSIKVASRARVPSRESAIEEDTLLLLECDEGAGEPRDATGYLMPPPPARFTPQATCYAVYDFLERFCGVRWYAPGDDGTIIPGASRLSVTGEDVRRRPALEFRDAPPSLRDLPWGLVARGSYRTEDAALFMCRMRLGGRNFYTMHSFDGYYDRFWKKNPKRPEVFERRWPEFFAQGHAKADPPPQLCYTNPAVVEQVVKDCRARFDAGAEMVDLVPMDNGSHCNCADCRAALNPTESDGFFSNGRASDLVHGFANKVAAELRKSHPDRFVGVLAYYDYARFPRKIADLEPNVLVGPCLHVRNWWCPPMKANDLGIYRSWVGKAPGRIHCLVIYQCFPGDATGGRFRFFPGFHAHMLADAMRMFHEDGVRGIHLCGVAEYIDGYLTLRMMDRPDVDVDEALDEFFRLYYGAAAPSMRAIYDLIERTYSDPASYPPQILDPRNYTRRDVGDKLFHQTKEMAWKWLGTQERIDRIVALMKEAQAADVGAAERRRLVAFEEVAIRHLLEGRASAAR